MNHSELLQVGITEVTLAVGLMGFMPANQSEYMNWNPQLCTETWTLTSGN